MGLKVLIVDDFELNRTLAAMLIKQFFSELIIEQAENGLDALEKCEQNDFALIIMDIQMPKMDGFKASQAIRKKHPEKDITIIGMTANMSDVDEKRYLDAGMNEFFIKPITPEDFRDSILKWCPQFSKHLLEKASDS